MEPMYLCDECLKQYQKRSPVHDSEEKQESTHCDECAKKERELTFPMYWIIPFWEIAPNSGPTFGFFMVDRRPATMRNRFPKKPSGMFDIPAIIALSGGAVSRTRIHRHEGFKKGRHVTGDGLLFFNGGAFGVQIQLEFESLLADA